MEAEKFIPVLLSTQSLGLVTASFLCIRKVQVDDQFIKGQIRKVNDQHDKFIKFCDGSKSLSDALVNYSEEILSMVSVIKEDNFTREELISNLLKLLPVAKKNKCESENYEKQIKQIKGDLIHINSELFKNSKENNEKIKLDTKEELSIKKKNKRLIIFRFCSAVARIIIGVAKIVANSKTAAITGAPVMAETAAIIYISTEIANLAISLLSNWEGDLKESIETNNNKIINLNAKLKDEREFVNVIKNLEEKIGVITWNISNIVTHWEEQVNSLKKIIERLESGLLNPKFDIEAIYRRADEIKEQAREYHRIMNLIQQIEY
ncbi:hypothetical protein Glove_423g47 [Diversispora epigaea]|uniref:Uncharacterized protein n=1 Tax=Diversispora epigaea TaxID=1348612 RepID=A0A397GYL9_9GLOM|nr:hypothetical protein Glove_423g47 [Diversispora epigaea]